MRRSRARLRSTAVKVVAISYADAAFAGYQRVWALSAGHAGFDEIRALGPVDLDSEFATRHSGTLACSRGAGSWLWKPYAIARTLAGLDDGDVLFYSDSAAHFVGSIDHIVQCMDDAGLDVLLLGEAFLESQYTKRDAFILMGCDSDRFAKTPQRFASFIALRKSTFSMGFAARYLAYCEDARILTDRPNEMGLPNYQGYIDHRHDQSVLSLLSKQDDLAVPSTSFVAEGLARPSGQVMNHTRTHHTPTAVLHHLLAIGVLGVSDIAAFAEVANPDGD
jgi:hypothetical protein